MNRRLFFVLSLSLSLIVLLSACSAKKEGSVTILPTGDVRTLAAPSRPPANAPQETLDDRQQLADYQGTLPLFSAAASTVKRTHPADYEQLNDRQQLADYQGTLPHFSVEPQPTHAAR